VLWLSVLVLVGCAAASTPVLKAGTAAPKQHPVVGLVANNPLSFTAARSMSAPVVRLEFRIGTDPAAIAPTIDRLAAQGSAALLLAGFYRSMPTEEEARSVDAWARAFGPGSGRSFPVRTIEFGNETSYPYQYGDRPGDASYSERARTYALRAAVAAGAIRTADPRVGLLVQADDGGQRSTAWVDAMFKAVPNLDAQVSGWVVHPYGPTYVDRLSWARGQLAERRATKPLWITEWGVATDGGRCLDDNYGWNTCMDSAQAAAALRAVVADLGRFDVAGFFVYQLTDHYVSGRTDREGYFGVLTSDGRSKGDYTDAVRALFTAECSVGESGCGP